MFKRINELMAKIATGYKTFVATGALTFISVYANTKGFDVVEMQAWLEAGWKHINNLLLVLGALVAWFRQLGKKREVKS